MYKSIFYNHSENKIYLDDDEQGRIEFQYKPQVYKRIKEYQEGALPVLTGGYAIPYNQKYEKGDISILEQDISPEIRVLRDLYYEYDETLPKGHRIIYLDIECEIVGKLDKEAIEDPKGALTSIALLDIPNKQKICFVVDKEQEIENINENNKLIIPCKSEKDLCIKFLNKWKELDATIVVTYNGKWFDIPYLYYRLCKVIGRDGASKLSPIGKMNIQTWNPNDINVSIGGINHLDYMLLHKKYIMKEEPSYKLKDIGEKYVNLTKIEYEGTLNQLFKEDKNKFIEYNLRDVEILEKLEDKLKFVELTIMLCHDCCVPYEQVYLTTSLNEGKILKLLKKRNIISNNKPTTDNPNLKNQSKQDYAGGFLLDPKIGISDWGADFDATSHYPRILIDLNMGVETLVGWIENNDKYNCWLSFEELNENSEKEYVLNNLKGKTKNINGEKLTEFIKKNNLSVAASGALFRTDEKSILAEILEDGFNQRQVYKTKMKKAGNEKNWNLYKFYELRSTAIKYFINGAYGALSLPSFRFSDGKYILSKATTLTGQRITQEVIREMNNYMLEDLKV